MQINWVKIGAGITVIALMFGILTTAGIVKAFFALIGVS